MAKTPPKSPVDQDGEISFTMVKFTMKGSDTSLQKGMDAIKSAFAQAGFAVAPPELRVTRASNAAVKQLQGAVAEAETEVADEVVGAEEDESSQVEAEPVVPVTLRKVSPRKPPNYKIINDLVIDDVEPTLADFCADKDPQIDLDRYKCVAYWFKHHKGTPDLSVEHFFSVYMLLDWKLPKHPSQPIQDLRRQQVFLQGEKHGTSTIGNLGEKQVRELVKKDA